MDEGREELSGLREEAGPVEPETEGGDDDGIESDDGPESVHETVAKEYERLQREAEAEANGDAGAEPQTPEAQKGEKLVRKRGRPSKADIAAREAAAPQPFQIPAPNRLNLKQKETFNQMPEPLQRAVHQMFKDFQGQHTQIVQKATAAERESRAVTEAVRPYLLAHPELAAEGYTESRFVAGLVAAHQRLTDPKTQRQALAELCQEQGLRQEIVNAILQDAPAAAPQPQMTNLPDDAREAIEYIKRMRAAETQRASQSILSELEGVQNEVDQFGRYVYPRLHEQDFLEEWKPLVSALARRLPYAEAGKEAYRILTRGDGNSAQVNQARLPANNPQIERAQRAAVSVRGRSAPSAALGSNWIDDVPVEELGDVRQTVRLALENMRRGVQ